MLLLGAGERGEGLGRPEFVMRRRRRSVRILAILALWPRPAPHPKMFFFANWVYKKRQNAPDTCLMGRISVRFLPWRRIGHVLR